MEPGVAAVRSFEDGTDLMLKMLLKKLKHGSCGIRKGVVAEVLRRRIHNANPCG